MGVNLGFQMEFYWEVLNIPWLVDLEGFLFRKFRWTPAG